MTFYILSFLLSFVSGDVFREMANHLYEDLQPALVQPGDVIFVKTHDLGDFFSMAHPQIASPYILLSHVTDEDAPGPFGSYLKDPKLIAWFAMNYDGYPHHKIHPIPIGVAPADLPHGNLEALRKFDHPFEKKHLLFMNFTIQTYSSERWPLFKQFALAPFCFRTGKKPFEEYLLDLASSKFVLAPRGAGFDTYRLWEALYVGSIPIVKTSPLDSLYQDLPVLIVQDWSEVTEEFLNEKYEEFSSKAFSLEKLKSDVWVEKIKKSFDSK